MSKYPIVDKLSETINDLGNVLTAAKWPEEIDRGVGQVFIKDSKEVYKELVGLTEDVHMLSRDFHDCVNELCLQCGKYRQEHEGACDGCRWLLPRRGW